MGNSVSTAISEIEKLKNENAQIRKLVEQGIENSVYGEPVYVYGPFPPVRVGGVISDKMYEDFVPPKRRTLKEQ